jgi:hypothetical protein
LQEDIFCLRHKLTHPLQASTSVAANFGGFDPKIWRKGVLKKHERNKYSERVKEYKEWNKIDTRREKKEFWRKPSKKISWGGNVSKKLEGPDVSRQSDFYFCCSSMVLTCWKSKTKAQHISPPFSFFLCFHLYFILLNFFPTKFFKKVWETKIFLPYDDDNDTLWRSFCSDFFILI